MTQATEASSRHPSRPNGAAAPLQPGVYQPHKYYEYPEPYLDPEFTTRTTGSALSQLSYRHNTSSSPALSDTATDPLQTEQASSLLQEDELKNSALESAYGASTIVNDGVSVRQTWWTRHFERPDWFALALHVVLCTITIPLFYFALPRIHDTLFWARLYVGLACAIVGIGVGHSMLRLARRWVEAAAWATVIHRSVPAQQHGVRLGDLAGYAADGASLLGACKMLIDRLFFPGVSRQSRRSYDKSPWSLFLLFFLLCFLCTMSLSFVLGRIVNIDVEILRDAKNYHEVAIAGELAEEDLKNAHARMYNPLFSSSFTGFLPSNDQPRVIAKMYNQTTIYFAEATSAQLREGGHGLGIFLEGAAGSVLDVTSHDALMGNGPQRVAAADATTDLVVRFPKWGLRIHCEKLPDFSSNMILHSSSSPMDVALIPRDFLSHLFGHFELPLPEAFNNNNITQTLGQLGKIPDGLAGDTSRWVATLSFAYPNATIDFASRIFDNGSSGMGWSSVEGFMVRLDQRFASKADFAVHKKVSVSDKWGSHSDIDVGFDAIVCVQLYEPWVVEVYNSTSGGPKTLSVLGPGRIATDKEKVKERRRGSESQANHTLSSVGKFQAFEAARTNMQLHAMIDSQDNSFLATSALSYFSNGTGDVVYGGLDATYFTNARAISEATFTLPLLVGSGLLTARVYENHVEALVRVALAPLLGALGTVLLLGIIAGLCTPRLPRGLPRREFGLYSWLAVIYGDHFLREFGDGRLQHGMDVSTVEKNFADTRVFYAV